MIPPNSPRLSANLIGWFDFRERRTVLSWSNRGRIASMASCHDPSVVLDIAPNGQPQNYSPLYHNHAAYFDGDDDGMGTNDTPLATHASNHANFTVLAVIRPSLTAPDGTQVICSWRNTADPDSRVYCNIKNDGSLQIEKRRDAGVATETATTSAGVLAANQWQVVGWGTGSTASVVRMLLPDGTLHNTGSFSTATTTLNFFSIGEEMLGATGGFKAFQGHIAAVFVYDGLLSDSEFLDVRDYLSSQFTSAGEIVTRTPSRIDLQEFGVVQRTDVTAALQKAVNFMLNAGCELRIPGGTWYVSDEIQVGGNSDALKDGGMITGVGAGFAPIALWVSDDAERVAGQTLLRWKGNASNKSMFRVWNQGCAFRDIAMLGGDVANRELEAFIELNKAVGVGTGELKLTNCTFASNLTHGPNVAGIKTAGVGNNEDESAFYDCIFTDVAYPLWITQQQSVGWKCFNWRAENATTVFRFDGGGKLYVYGAHLANPGTSEMVVLDLKGGGTLISRNNASYFFSGLSLDGGTNSENVVLVRNTAPIAGQAKPVIMSVTFSGCMAEHTSQTIPMIDVEESDALIVVENSRGLPRQCGGAFAHLTSKSATERAALVVSNCHAKGDFDIGEYLDATSDAVLHAVNNKPEGKGMLLSVAASS